MVGALSGPGTNEERSLPYFIYRLLIAAGCSALRLVFVEEHKLASWLIYFFLVNAGLFATEEILALGFRDREAGATKRTIAALCGTLWLTFHFVAVSIWAMTGHALSPGDFRSGLMALTTGDVPVRFEQGAFLLGFGTVAFAVSWFVLKGLERLPGSARVERSLLPASIALGSVSLLGLWFSPYLFASDSIFARALLGGSEEDARKNADTLALDFEAHLKSLDASLEALASRKSLHIRANRTPHLLLVHVESLRSDYFDERLFPKTSPLIRNCYKSPRHYSTGNTTSNAITGVLTGLSALYAESIRRGQIAPLPLRALSELGYDQHVWFPNSTLLFDDLLSDFFVPDFEIHRIRGEDRALLDAEIVEQFTQRKESSTPRLDYLLLDSSHYDYAYPDSFERFTPTARLSIDFNPLTGEAGRAPADSVSTAARTGLKNRYLNSLFYVDSLLSKLLLGLSASSGETWTVIFGDHGEALWDDEGRFGHRSALTDQQTRVPLVLCGFPKLSSKAVISSHEDIFPTIFSQMGLRSEVPFMSGKDIFGGDQGRSAVLTRMPVSHVESSRIFAAFTPEMRVQFLLRQTPIIMRTSSNLPKPLERAQAQSLLLESLGAARLTQPPTQSGALH